MDTFYGSLVSVLKGFECNYGLCCLSRRYLEHDHYRHCVPSNVSSGLATLPLDHVWVDGRENKSWPTNKKLPTGEMLDGKMAYSEIMAFFTTNDMTPDYVNKLGKEQLKKLYPQVSTQIRVLIKERTTKAFDS